MYKNEFAAYRVMIVCPAGYPSDVWLERETAAASALEWYQFLPQKRKESVTTNRGKKITIVPEQLYRKLQVLTDRQSCVAQRSRHFWVVGVPEATTSYSASAPRLPPCNPQLSKL